jgi:enolase
MTQIKQIYGRKILDSRAEWTTEVELVTEEVNTVASTPKGKSTGKYEVKEVEPNKALSNIKKLNKVLQGTDCQQQREVDSFLDPKYGSNTTIPISLAVARAGAEENGLLLFDYLNKIFAKKEIKMPRPFFNIINGGKHSGNGLPIQEFMISPKTKSYQKSLEIAVEVYKELRKIIQKKFNQANVGDEGGFAPNIKKAEEALDLIMEAIKKTKQDVEIGIDCAASEFYHKGYYQLHNKMTSEQLIDYYKQLIKKYPIISIEDPFHEDDFESFAKLKKETTIQIVGDDLTVTNIDRINKAIKHDSCNCLLLKVNQIGTLTKALDAANLAYQNGWKVMVSHRSGDTEDPFIADLAVGIGADYIKTGAPCRSERTAKYNQLLRINEAIKQDF